MFDELFPEIKQFKTLLDTKDRVPMPDSVMIINGRIYVEEQLIREEAEEDRNSTHDDHIERDE